MRKYRQIASKALKTKVMVTEEALIPFIPHTTWYSDENFKKMIDIYGDIVVKPDKGAGGSGVIRVISKENYYVVQYRKAKKQVSANDLIYKLEKYLKKSTKYIIQRGIEMAKINNKPFDIRIMLQKIKGKWLISGMVARVAANGRVVTNHCKGGYPLSVSEAVVRAFGKEGPHQETLHENLRALSYMTAEVLDKRFPGIKELGIDVGPDEDGHPWIFEVNTCPQFFVFKHLKNHHKQYRRIIQRHKQLI